MKIQAGRPDEGLHSLKCFLVTVSIIAVSKGAITSKIKHAIKHKTSPARLALLLHNCCATVVQVLQDLFYVLLHVSFYL